MRSYKTSTSDVKNKKSKVTMVTAFKNIIWPRRNLVFLGLILIVLSRLSSLVLPWKTKVLLDEVIPNKDFEELYNLLFLVAGAILIQAVTSFLLTKILSVQAQFLISELRAQVQKKVLSLPLSFFDNTKSGALVSRIMNDVEGVRNLIGTGLVQLVGGTITAVISLFLLINISLSMTLFVFVPVGIFGFVALKAFAYIRPIFKLRGKINAEVNGRLTETLAGVRVIKAFNAEAQENKVFEKVYDKIVAKGTELTGIKKMLFFWAVNLGLKFEPYGQNGWCYEFQLKIVRKLIFSKWQEALGGNINTLVSGSAALQPRLIRVFSAAGMPILEGYGLTETSPVISVNCPFNNGIRIGTVGRIINNVDVRIAEDGEILVKGPNVMMGYYKDQEKTDSVMSGDYFHTGDIGEISEDGFLKITDRKKEMFKTSGGKYVAPALLENELKQSRFIEQIMVIGEGEKMPAALIQPNFEFIKNWEDIKHISVDHDNESLCNNPKVIERIQQEIDICNKNFGKWEQIKKFKLTPDEWSIDGGHLTPTLKMKRKVIKEIYIDLFNAIYEK